MRSVIQPSGQDGRTFTERARRAQIVESAIETIAELGFAPASLAEIGRRAGVSKGLISYHFAGKAELIDRVIAEVTDAGRAFMLPRVAAVADAPGRLRAYIASNLEFMATHRAHIAAVVQIANALPHERDGQPAAYGGVHRRVVAELEDLLAAGQGCGELGAFCPRVMAVTIRAAIDAAGYQASEDPDLDLADYARELCGLFDRATRTEETT